MGSLKKLFLVLIFAVSCTGQTDDAVVLSSVNTFGLSEDKVIITTDSGTKSDVTVVSNKYREYISGTYVKKYKKLKNNLRTEGFFEITRIVIPAICLWVICVCTVSTKKGIIIFIHKTDGKKRIPKFA